MGQRMEAGLKRFVGLVLLGQLAALAVIVVALLMPRPTWGNTGPGPQRESGEMVYALVVISQPVQASPDALSRHFLDGQVYTEQKLCVDESHKVMAINRIELAAGTTTYRRFAGCITLPAPGRFPYIPNAQPQTGTPGTL